MSDGLVAWPVWDPLRRRTVWRRVPAASLPPGWQGLGIRVYQRLATCEEVDCQFREQGWTEAAGGPFLGDQTEQWGGRFHQPGTTCPTVHKVQADRPPVFLRNGQPAVMSEFSERVAESVEAVTHIRTRGL